MKKVLHIQVLPKMAGVQYVSYYILKSLPNNEYEKHIMFSDNMDDLNKNHCREMFESIGCKVLFLKSLNRSIGLTDFKAIRDIYKLCKKENYDIVHTNSTKPGVVGRIAAKLSGVPFIVHTIHGLSFHEYLGFPKWQFYWMCEMFSTLFCNKIVLVNKFYSKYFKCFKNKILTIYNGIDYNLKEDYMPDRNDNNSVRILFVGRLDEQKDPITMIKAFDKAYALNNNLALTIVGDGELMRKCKQLVSDLSLNSVVHFEGWRDDVDAYYQSHDIFITTSIYEAFGLVFLDAGFYHLPSVSTNVEGIPEVIIDGETGLLSKPKDIESLSNNILKLASDYKLRLAMGLNAHNRVIKEFNADRMTDSYLNIYLSKFK